MRVLWNGEFFFLSFLIATANVSPFSKNAPVELLRTQRRVRGAKKGETPGVIRGNVLGVCELVEG